MLAISAYAVYVFPDHGVGENDAAAMKDLKTPAEAATTFAKQTVKYLLGTKDYGILYPYGGLLSTAMSGDNGT